MHREIAMQDFPRETGRLKNSGPNKLEHFPGETDQIDQP